MIQCQSYYQNKGLMRLGRETQNGPATPSSKMGIEPPHRVKSPTTDPRPASSPFAPPSSLQPRAPSLQATRRGGNLIGSSAIRIRGNSPRINHLNFSNRLKTPKPATGLDRRNDHLCCDPNCLRALRGSLCSQPRSQDVRYSAVQSGDVLIGTAAIRIGCKPHRISHLNFSNRIVYFTPPMGVYSVP
jgi:hypothetical protein